ncbi:MAG: insulinase family protein [Lachnospiraceae bacterium]
MRIEELEAYEIIENREISDLNSIGYVVRHKKTGAKIVLLSNDDNNKVFCIGFRTPPENSTGVPHILEHSVLCGSREFPAKDPFVELVKGSLNTFLNAMTYPDKTVYPVASCNDKDFQNLMHVYLDAVFYPNIYQEKKIFMQEGWHYELEQAEDDLQINGVVYNEMKGAFSSPDDVLDREVFNSLFPHTAYGVESGGDPDYIPTLTYEDFIEFHQRYYHPSNSYIYLYGDMDMAEKLDFIDKHYLSQFDALQIDSAIALEAPFSEPIEVSKQYPITEAESETDSTYLAYNAVIGTSLDQELYIAFQILDYAICSAPGAPLKQALIDKGIGKDVYSNYENGIYQPYFSIVAKNANPADKAEFVHTIEEVFRTLVAEGIDKKALMAGENYYEFRYREADFGTFPKGLMYGLQVFDSWLYDESTPFLHIEANATFTKMKDKIGTDYFEKLIEQYLLRNTHKAVIMVEPIKGLTTKLEQQLQDKLNTYKNSLTTEEINAIIADTKALQAYQEEPTAPEILAKIPLLTREDMTKEAEGFVNREVKVGETTLLRHDLFTNGIGYLSLLFDMSHVDAKLLPYVGILKSILGYVNTKTHSYGELFHEINIHTGGMSSKVSTYVDAHHLQDFKITYEWQVSVLFENLKIAFDLLQEIIFTSDLTDEKRILEIISEQRSRMQAEMTSSGHSLAALRAMSYFSKNAEVAELTSGIPYYRLLEELEAHFDTKKEELFQNLKTLMKIIFRPENLMVDYTADANQEGDLQVYIKDIYHKLYTAPIQKGNLQVIPVKKNEGFTTSSQVQYVCRAGNFVKQGLPYTGTLKVLKVIMGYDYLWNNIRVKGGAYGCMCNYGRTGDSYFVSYRDPNLEKTIAVYEAASKYLKTFTADERTMTKFLIGTISNMDTPLNPAAKGSRSLGAYLSHMDIGILQQERDEVLQVTQEDIRKLAAYVDAFMQEEAICVVGNEEKIQKNKTLFDKVESLFH